MRTLLLTITITLLSACTSTKPKPYTERDTMGEVKSYTESLECQIQLITGTERNLEAISEFRVYRRPEISKLVRLLKRELLACTRVKSQIEVEIDRIAASPDGMVE